MRRLFPDCATVDDPASIYDRLVFPGVSDDRAYIYVNMVSSADGRAQVDGRAVGLGSPVDQELMRRLRAQADCVLNGSGTVLADQVFARLRPEQVEARLARGQREQPLWAVVTASGNLRLDDQMFRKASPRPIVFAAEATPAEKLAEISRVADLVVAGSEQPDACEVARILRQRYGCRLVLSEGGPIFNHSMLRAGVLDELFLTFAPKLVAGTGKTIVDGPQLARDAWPRLELVSLYEHVDELFFRYRIRRG